MPRFNRSSFRLHSVESRKLEANYDLSNDTGNLGEDMKGGITDWVLSEDLRSFIVPSIGVYITYMSQQIDRSIDGGQVKDGSIKG